jgi:hypothetical protein
MSEAHCCAIVVRGTAITRLTPLIRSEELSELKALAGRRKEVRKPSTDRDFVAKVCDVVGIDDARIEASVINTLYSRKEATHWSSRMAKESGLSVSSAQRIWLAFGGGLIG